MKKDTMTAIERWLTKALTDEELREAIIEWLRASAKADKALARWRDRRGTEDHQ